MLMYFVTEAQLELHGRSDKKKKKKTILKHQQINSFQNFNSKGKRFNCKA